MMPSPFPGMDPYIENPARWPDFHHRFLGALGDEIGARTKPNYLVRFDARRYETDVAGEPAAREPFFAIKTCDTFETVTIVAMLSPANKRRDSAGLREYLEHRERVLASDASLVELDMLRDGVGLPGAPIPPVDYFVYVHRARQHPTCEVYPFTIRDRLPEIQVPLEGREDVRIALQPLIATCYDEADYGLEFDYSYPPIPPLREADAEWAAGLLSK